MPRIWAFRTFLIKIAVSTDVKKAIKFIIHFLAFIAVVMLFALGLLFVGQIKQEPAAGYLSVIPVLEKPKVITNPVDVLFVGDIMLDRNVAVHAEKYGTSTLFSNIAPIFSGPDVVVGNLEGTITNNKSVSQANHSILHFTFDPKYAPILKNTGFSVLSLANNHALDFGVSGYDQTVTHLINADIAPFGSPMNDRNLSTKIFAKSQNICFVGYMDLFSPDPAPAIQDIKNIRSDCSKIVLFAHWGEEYHATSTARQKMLAHSFIDAGADLVIGSHPHVVEPYEIYKNKAIFYSLGNFIFDQNFSYATMHGLVVNVLWDNNKTTFTLMPTTINNEEVQLADPEDAEKVMATSTFTLVDDGTDI